MKKLSNYPIIQLSNYPIIQLSNKINWFKLAMVYISFVLFSTTSCKKEVLTDEKLQVTPQLREKPGRDCLKPIKIFCDSILCFEDEQHYEMVYQCLEQAYEAHNDWFDQQTQNMSDEDAEAHAASIGFNEDQPLMDFEAFQNFYSYRRWLRGVEATLPNQGQNPLDVDFLLDDIEATLTSRSRCIRIGDVTIYHYNDDEVFYTTSTDCEIIRNLIRDPHQTLIENSNEVKIDVMKKVFSNACNFYMYPNGKQSGAYAYTNNRTYYYKIKFKKTIAFNNPSPHAYKLASKMINFRRNNLGLFFNTFNKVSAGANVGFYVMDICNVSENLGGQKNLRRHFRRSYTHLSPQLIGVPYLIYIRNLSVFGRFRISIGNNTYQNDIYIDNLN